MKKFEQLPRHVRVYVGKAHRRRDVATHAFNAGEKHLISAVALAVRLRYQLLVASPADMWKFALESVIKDLDLIFTVAEQEQILKGAKGE